MKTFTAISVSLLIIGFLGFVLGLGNTTTPEPEATHTSITTPLTTEATITPHTTEAEVQAAWATFDAAAPADGETVPYAGKRVEYLGTSTLAIHSMPLISYPSQTTPNTFHVFVVSPGDAAEVTHQDMSALAFNALANTLPACQYEDSTMCQWAADTQGNELGRDTINLTEDTSVHPAMDLPTP